ncbi:hypothetical protein M434DRAFT_69573 [Hypoxylon sp. CO27-5]|nr:hypothetical protein M434DRAFT_69573 [Hypoxylon sp. CO27-5]
MAGYQGYGLIGYGISMYNPTCAYACHDALSEYQLSCSVPGDGDGHHHMGDTSRPAFVTLPDCYATDDNFLRSVSYCISTHCPDVPTSDLERYWDKFLVGRSPDQPVPKEPYTIALLHADPPPNTTASYTTLLNSTALVNEQTYLSVYNAHFYFEQTETRQSTYGLVDAFRTVIPIACSLLRFVPFPKVVSSWFNAHFIDPPLFGRRHRNPVLNLAIMPTRGQAMLIAYFITINVVLSCAGYKLVLPNAFYGAKRDQLMVYIANRGGVLSLANLPLLVLYAGRNNFLLSITDWSYSTFVLLHRWIAILCTIEACIHSAMYLHIYLVAGFYSILSKEPFWICGIVATLSFCLLLPTSVLPIRQKMYNLFLSCHFIFAFTALMGVYFHIFHRFKHEWGYETWIYIAFAIWAFDRTMRFIRLARNGLKTAEITIIDENNIRVDIPGVTAQGHAFLYFPTLSWRVWENHPFSVMGTLMAQEPLKTSSPSTSTTGENTSLPYTGGVGITAVVPVLRTRSNGCVRLFWGARSPQLVDAVKDVLGSSVLDPGIVGEISVGRRLNLREILEREVLEGSETAIVVCGPVEMADEVRAIVCELGRKGRTVKLVDEAFSW